MLLYQSPYKTTRYYPEHSILEEEWHLESKNLNEDLYKEEVKKYISFLEAYKPLNTLQNIRHLRFIISPQLQLWINENVMPVADSIGNTRLAIVLSEDLFTQVSVEQTLTENPEEYTFSIHYFRHPEEAMSWLKS